ncbi:MAG: TonB C-terminal domain-containing protein [SAR324 cluster bacterium]|nr:TonB C-terminal domain-containing protein [SAR324 cluster bacterium]
MFLLKSIPRETRLTLVLIGENRKWRVKHEACLECRLTQQDMLKSIVLRMESYTGHPTSMLDLKPEQPSKSSSLEYSLKKEESDQKIKTKVINLTPEPKISESKIVPARKAMLPLELLKFKIAQRRYNQLIWKNIKKDLMFFRQKHRNRSSSNLKTRLRLQIDQFGKVIERRLLKTSGSQKFDKIIMDSVDQLKLPPPMELLIRHPPYVVTILIQP